MASTAPAGDDLIARLKTYEEVCNRYDIDAALALFTPDGVLEYRGETYGGERLRAAHEYDLGAHNQVEFRDCRVEGDTVYCTFVATDEACRILGLTGAPAPAAFTFRDGLITTFACGTPDPEAWAVHREARRPFIAWVREHYPAVLEQPWTFDFRGGDELRRLAEEWRDSGAQAATAAAPPR